MKKYSTEQHGTFWREGHIMFVKRDGHYRSIKVVDDSEFVYKLQKTQIRARGGAEGLYNWMVRTLEKDFAICFVYKVLDWIFYREVK